MGRMGARIGAAIIITAMGTPVFADGILPFDGIFGNQSGCHLYATGEKLSDDYLLLTPDTFASGKIGCDFNALLSSDNAIFTIDAVCSPGGPRRVTVTGFGEDGYTIRLDAQTFVGPIAACPDLFTLGEAVVSL